MYPDDRVLVGVINRKKDFISARDHHWYRIPQAQMPQGIYAEYIAFFLSGALLKEQKGAIAYFAECRGLELARRRDLLPSESSHRRANDVYYVVQLGSLREKIPRIANSDRRSISFIQTTWQRFVNAREIRDLYADADYHVDRIYQALKTQNLDPVRYWSVDQLETGHAPQVRVRCKNGDAIASTDEMDDAILIDSQASDDDILDAIQTVIKNKGGKFMPDSMPEGKKD